MLIDLAELSPNQRYFCMTQSVIPRPIAWMLTKNDNASFNLAPFSYFTAVCSDPALLMVSIGYKSNGDVKDTVKNLKQYAHTTIHIADESLLAPLNQSALELDYGESEVSQIGLDLMHHDHFTLPMIKKSPIAFDCELYDIQQIGAQQQNLVFLNIKHVYIDDLYVTQDANHRISIDAKSINPLFRLGGNEYGNIGEIISRKRGT